MNSSMSKAPCKYDLDLPLDKWIKNNPTTLFSIKTLNNKFNVTTKDNYMQYSILQYISMNYVHISEPKIKMDLLLCNKNAVNFQNTEGNTALILACKKQLNIKENNVLLSTYKTQSNINVIKRLLEAGANVNITNKDGNTALHETQSSESIVKILLETGANINMKNKQGNTALHLACRYKNINVIKMLLEDGANPNIRNINDSTSLHISCYEPNINVIKMLLEAGANPNIINKVGNSALLLACHKPNIIVIKMLLKSGANPNIKTKHQNTALIIACKTKNEELVNLLLCNHANPNIKDNYATPLIYACKYYNKKNIEILLEFNADVTTYNYKALKFFKKNTDLKIKYPIFWHKNNIAYDLRYKKQLDENVCLSQI